MPTERAAAIYSRKSRYTGKGESVENQAALCRTYIQNNFGNIPVLVFEDEGFSGKNLNRPGFQAMMQAVHSGKLSAVVVYRLDRISRNIGDFSALIEELAENDTAFISIREQFDTSSPMGRAMMYIASVFSQLERETIAERIRDNLNGLARTGRWLGGNPPTGYTGEAYEITSPDGRKKRICRLRVLPDEAALVQQIFHLYGKTGSLTQTESTLLSMQIKTKTGRDFTRFAVRSILQNPVYMAADAAAFSYFEEKHACLSSPPAAFDGTHGVLVYHRTDQSRKRSVRLPPAQWIVCAGEHEPLVSSAEWLSVQDLLARGSSSAYRQPRRNTALLTGCLFCSCGSRMYPRLSGKGLSGSYVCKCKERSNRARCSQTNAPIAALDDAVLLRLGTLSESRACLAERLADCIFSPGSAGEALRKKQARLLHRINALVDSLADAAPEARQMIYCRIDDLHREQQQIETELAAEKSPDAEITDALCRRCADFSACLSAMPLEPKRSAVHRLVQKIVWDGTCAHIYFAEKNA